MQDGVLITKNKILYKYWDSEAEQPKYRISEIQPRGLVDHLWGPVKLKDVTLGRIFEIVEPMIAVWRIILAERLEPLFLEMSQPPKPDTRSDDDKLQYLELYWDAIHEPDENTTDIWPSLHAFGNSTEKSGIYYSVSLSPINSMKDLVIRPKENFQICYYLGEEEPKKFGTRPFKLIDLLKGLFWELAWYGPPEKRDKIIQELKENYDPSKSIPLSEVFPDYKTEG